MKPIKKWMLPILAICLLLATYIGAAQPYIPEAENAYRIVPLLYNEYGQLHFGFNLAPFDYIDSNQDTVVYITVFDCKNTPRTVTKNLGKYIDKNREYSETIGFDVNAVQMMSSAGNSPRWNIFETCQPPGKTATAQPKTRETFYVVTRYVNCEGSGACARTVTVNAETYNAIKDKRDLYKIDNIKEIQLVTDYITVFSSSS